MITELTEDNLSEVLKDGENTVVQFSAGWCGNCRMMKPKMKKLASEMPNIKFVIADAEKFPNSRKLADVSNLPTFASFNKGALLDQVQTNKFEVLKDFVNETTRN
ncbi:MAG: thioredoxin family protein [Bacteroidota bacterium]